MKSWWKRIAPVVVWLVIFVVPPPAGLNANQWHYFAIFAAVIVGLVLESMAPGAVGLIGLTLATILGYIDPDPTKSLRWALSGFGDATVWLIVGAFVFAIAGHTIEHRSERWHHLPDRQQHSKDLWLRAGANSGKDRHLCTLDRVRDDRRHELAFSDRAGAQRRGTRHRKEDRRHRR